MPNFEILIEQGWRKMLAVIFVLGYFSKDGKNTGFSIDFSNFKLSSSLVSQNSRGLFGSRQLNLQKKIPCGIDQFRVPSWPPSRSDRDCRCWSFAARSASGFGRSD